MMIILKMIILKKAAHNHLLPWIMLAEVFFLLIIDPRSSRVPSSHLLMNKGEEFAALNIFLMLNKLWILSTHLCSTYCSSQLCSQISTTAASAVHADATHIGRWVLKYLHIGDWASSPKILWFLKTHSNFLNPYNLKKLNGGDFFPDNPLWTSFM